MSWVICTGISLTLEFFDVAFMCVWYASWNMALRELKERALEMRRQGMSYSQIRAAVKVSKGTLSLWLKDMSLSKERIHELCARNQRRIENCRNTKAKKKQDRLDEVYKKVSKDIGSLSSREIFLCGLFLYWGEGSKTSYTAVEITNTDPSMLRFTLIWFRYLGIDIGKIKVKLKIYKDTDKEKVTMFWSDLLQIDRGQFRYYIKKSNQADISYKTGFGHGTCSIYYGNRDLYEKIMQSLQYFKNYFL